MRIDILYYNPFFKGEFLESKDQVKPEYAGFINSEIGLGKAQTNYFGSQRTDWKWQCRSLTFRIIWAPKEENVTRLVEVINKHWITKRI